MIISPAASRSQELKNTQDKALRPGWSLRAAGAQFAIMNGLDLKAVRVKEGPKVDGLLTDPAWQSAFAIPGFRLVEPRPDEDPSEKTEARVLYDDASLNIGVYCHDMVRYYGLYANAHRGKVKKASLVPLVLRMAEESGG